MRKLLCASFIFFLLPLSAAFSQTAADIERLLGEQEVTCEQAAWFTLAAALEEPPADAQSAFALAVEKRWLPADAQGEAAINYGGLAFLMMKAFNLKGGMMYSITKSRRYAYREMKYRGFFTGRVYSNLAVSGEKFLQILGNVTDNEEGSAR